MNAANNLRDYGPFNFNQMEEVGSTSNVNIVVQWKQAQCYDCGTSDWYGTRRYLVTRNSDLANSGSAGTDLVQSTLLQDLGPSVDMGSYQTLHDFIAWGEQSYPASHYALVIWDHGAGWRNTRADMKPAPRSVSLDDAAGTEIEVWQLPQALSVPTPPDAVIFDASLMQMTEVAYEIRAQTGVVVGSEESPPGYGYPYHLILADLAASPGWSAAQLGTDIVNQTLAYYTANPGQNPEQNNTQSAVSTARLPALAASVDAFAKSLLAHASDSAALLANARNTAEHYTSGYQDYKDLYDYARLVEQSAGVPPDLKTAATNVMTALQAAVIADKNGPNHANSHGLSIYVPGSLSYLSTYGNLSFATDTHWPQWLQGQKQ